MIVSGIYKIQSIYKPERVYIGSSIDIYRRWRDHLKSLRSKKHHSLTMQRHYNKYGESDLKFSLILECPKEQLIAREQDFIDSLNPYFNTCKVAGSCLGIKQSKETCNKKRIKMIGNKHGVGNHWKATPETRENMSKARTGVNLPLHTEETKEKMRIAQRRRRLNNPVSEETKIRMRHPRSAESKQKIKDSWVVRKLKLENHG